MKKILKNFCIVGYGKHAKLKILPALMNSKKIKLSIVSKKNINLKSITQFKNLDEALLSCSDSTVFILATPPEIHYSQIKKIVSLGRDLFVEKPIFVATSEAKDIYNIAQNNKNIIVEMLMYKHTKLYNLCKNYFNKKKKLVDKIKIYFTLPSLPKKTFRDKKSIKSSIFYDIGCYIFYFLNDLSISIENLKIEKIVIKNHRLESISLRGFHNKLQIFAQFGVTDKYVNNVIFENYNKMSIGFENIFYGRKAKKNVNLKNSFKNKLVTFDDINGFEELFKVPQSEWKKSEKLRFEKLIVVNETMENLSSQIKL